MFEVCMWVLIFLVNILIFLSAVEYLIMNEALNND